jgi:hypothetical protein
LITPGLIEEPNSAEVGIRFEIRHGLFQAVIIKERPKGVECGYLQTIDKV